MTPRLPSGRARLARWAALGLCLLSAFLVFSSPVSAHERFVKHDMKKPLQNSFFEQKAGMMMGMDPNMVQVGLLVSLVLTAFLFIWFLREDLDEFIRYKVLSRLGGTPQRQPRRHGHHRRVAHRHAAAIASQATRRATTW